jgi:hypothetical protein
MQLATEDIARFDATALEEVASYRQKWREYRRQQAREKREG